MFYLINYIFVLLCALIFGKHNTRQSRKMFIIVTMLFIMIETSIRSITVGSDTYTYVDDFFMMANSSWGDISDRIIERYVINTSEMDIGHFVLGKFFSEFSHSFQLYTFFITSIFTIPLGMFLYRYTKDFYQLTFAVVFFIALMLIFPMCGARQMQAIGMGILSFMYVGEGKFLKSLIPIFIGSFIHLSILLLLPYIVLNFFCPQLGKKFHLLSFFVIPFVLLFTKRFVMILASFSGLERYEVYGEGVEAGGAITFIALIVMMSLFCYIAIPKEYLKSNQRIQKLYMVLPFVSIFGPLINSGGGMIRISMYYHMYLMVLIPYAIDLFGKDNNRKQMYAFMMFFLMLFSVLGTPLNYDFFWNDPPATWVSK